MLNSKKLILTHRNPARSCCVRLMPKDKQLQIRDEKTSMNYTGYVYFYRSNKSGDIK